MAENGKTKIIITVIIGLFGIMCFGFALTVTDKYKTARNKANDLEAKFAAGKEELLKIPALKEKVIVAEEAAKGATGEMESLQEELDEAIEELDAITEELESLQSGDGEDSAVAEGDDEADDEEAEDSESGSEEIKTLRDELAAAETTIDDLRSKLSTASSHATGTIVIGGTFNGQYSVDPTGEKVETIVKELHRGLDYHRTRVLPPTKEVCGECKPKHIIKKQIAVINVRIDELLTYTGNETTRRDRIGANAYVSRVTKTTLEKQSKIENALNAVLANYTNALKTISDCKLYSSLQRGQAKSALNKRISSYIGVLISKNQSGEFSTDDQDVKLLLSKLQTEQKYFLN
ncbi:MAG: hypothetical protein ACUZ8E_15900 [Candidatus Anammoxibacter sp.]